MKTRNESKYLIIFLVKNLQSECVGLSIEGTDSDEDENTAEIQLGSTTYQNWRELYALYVQRLIN